MRPAFVAPFLAVCLALAPSPFAHAALPENPLGRAVVVPTSSAVRTAVHDRLAVRDGTYQRITLDRPGRSGSLLIEFPDGTAALDLRIRSIRGQDFQLFEHQGERRIDREPSANLVLRGDAFLEGDGRRWRAAATLNAGRLRVFMHAEDGAMRGLQPLTDADPTAAPDLYVAYRSEDVDAIPGSCAVPSATLPKWSGGANPPEWLAASAATTLKKAELAIEGDVAYFAKMGNSVPNAQADVETIFNSITSIYEAEVGITYDISALLIETDGSEQYSGSGAEKVLENFRAYWNSNYGAIPRDTVHLLTGKNLTGNVIGLAYVGVICNKAFGYGLSESTFSMNLLQRVAVTAHEIGHNWNANHCNGQSDCAIMCSTIGGCSGNLQTFGAFETSEIVDFRDDVGCLTNALPPAVAPFLETFESNSLDAVFWKTDQGATISSKAIGETSGSRAVNLDFSGKPDKLQSKPIDYSALAGAAELSFYSENRGAETGEDLIVEYTNTMGNWVELTRVVATGVKDGSFQNTVVTLTSDAMNPGARLRFRAAVDQANDDWYVDDVQVRALSLATNAHLCGETLTAPVVSVITGGGLPGPQTPISITNCGTNSTSFAWNATKLAGTSWLNLLAPTSGSVGPSPDADTLTYAITATLGVTAIAHERIQVAQTSGNASTAVVPVTYIQTPATYLEIGDSGSGTISMAGESDEAWFAGTPEQTVVFTVTVPNADLKPTLTLFDASSTLLATYKLKASAQPQVVTFPVAIAGLYRMRVEGRNSSTGNFALAISANFAGHAAAKTSKLKPSTSGGTVSAHASLLPGALLDITIAPAASGHGPFAAAIVGPNGESLPIVPFAETLPDGGLLVRGVPMIGPGLTTVTVSGFAATESVLVTLAPRQPAPGSTQHALD